MARRPASEESLRSEPVIEGKLGDKVLAWLEADVWPYQGTEAIR
jgi:hypothetical protein